MAVGEEVDSVDIGLVTSKGLDSLAGTDIPELGKSITSAGNKGVLVRGVKADAHDVAEMIGKLGNALARLDIPLDTGHVSRRREDATIVDKAAARKVAGMSGKLTRNTRGTILLLVEVVNGADIVEATTSDVVAAGGVGAGHDPRGSQGDGVDFVGGVGIPDDELAIL